MDLAIETMRMLLVAGVLAAAGLAHADGPVQLAGAMCTTPPYLKCPDENCPSDRVINPGPVVEMETRRTYFLDYPCDLEPGEPVTLILSLHGGGSYGNWQRHYFPLLDYKDEYRLVIATPNSPIRVWTPVDDRYLQNIVTSLIDQLGTESIRAFWLVGHSQGGMTSNRLLRTDFFRDRVDGWLSLSGGRLGGNPGRAESFGPPPAAAQPAAAAPGQGMPAMFAQAAALLRELPDVDLSFIYTIGEREIEQAGVPEHSALAQALGCDGRVRRDDIADTKPGYVYDGSRQDPPNPAWGLQPGPGTAAVYEYTNCKDAGIVADVVRLEKGHTEGLEPNVTEALVNLVVSAPGGRIQRSR
jgi:pimeloyl-ACP methyl ester carboxylesterase